MRSQDIDWILPAHTAVLFSPYPDFPSSVFSDFCKKWKTIETGMEGGAVQQQIFQQHLPSLIGSGG